MREEIRNDLTWSRSRGAMFQECPRRYWFTYYGAWGGWEAAAPPRVRETYVLKHLQTRWMWVGSLVHQAVERALTHLRAGMAMPESSAQKWALEAMRAGFRESRDRRYRERPKRACGLVEHEYELAVTDDEWREAADHLKTCIAEFYTSPYVAFIPKLPRGSWLPMEELDHFLLDGVKVFVKPDAAWKSGEGTVEIVDWKTGRRDEEADPIQLACYAAFALEKKWAARAEDVTTTEYNLSSGHARETRMTTERLDQVKADIRASIAAMKAMLDDVASNAATESKFPVTEDSRACRTCNFRRICAECPLKESQEARGRLFT